MGRPYTGKIHVGTRREVRANGDIYVFERLTRYNPEKRRTETISTTLLGKIPAGEQEMVPTRPRAKPEAAPSPQETPETARSAHFGLERILDWIGRESGIDADLQACFSPDDARMLSTIARYWLSTDGAPLPRIESWQIMNRTPYERPITQDACGALFRSVGAGGSAIQSYFQCRAGRQGDGDLMLALDTATVSTCSRNPIETLGGCSRDHDGPDAIRLLVLHALEGNDPVAFVRQPGNVPDRIAAASSLRQMDALGLPGATFVADSGFCSQDSMTQFARERIRFLMPASPTVQWVREAIDACRDELGHFDRVCPFDHGISGVTRRRRHEFSFVRQRAHGDGAEGEEEKFTRMLYVHVFHRPEMAQRQEMRLRDALLSLRHDLLQGVGEFRPSAQQLIDRYLIVRRTERKTQVGFNMKAVEELRKYWGYFVLVSNSVRDPFEALKACRSREKVEDLLATCRDGFDGHEPRAWSPEHLHGRQFAQFVGLGYRCFLARKIQALRERLAQRGEGKTRQELEQEKQLLQWLNTRSLIQILDWFRCVDHMAASDGSRKAGWTAETTRRDELFLRMLGVS